MEYIISWMFSALDSLTFANILASVPGVVLGGFSLYFAHQKIGNRVLVTYSINSSIFTENRITNITLINKKNKPVTVFSIQVVINEDIVIEVEKFQPAIIIRPLEHAYIETTPFSSLHIDGCRFKEDYLSPKNLKMYLITDKGKLQCLIIPSPDLSTHFDFKHYRNTVKSTRSYNGKVYNDKAKYVIIYRRNSEQHTAFVDETGFIGEEWGYSYNKIPSAYMCTKEKAREFLDINGYSKLFQALIVEDLKK